MRNFPHFYRQQDIDHMMWGYRLYVYESPDGLYKYPNPHIDIKREGVTDFIRWATKEGTHVTTEGWKAIKEWVVAIPSGILDGIRETWSGRKSDETIVGVLSKAASFFRSEPAIAAFIEGQGRKLNIKDIATLTNLTDHAFWLKNIKELTPDALKNPNQTPLDQYEIYGPYQLLMSLPPAKRQKVYFDFVNKYIPERLQVERGWVGMTNAEKIDAMGVNGMKIAGEAIEGMLGLNKDLRDRISNPALQLAKDSLIDYYKTDHPDFWNPENKDRLKGIPLKLEEDYEHALQYEKFRGVPDIATDPDNLEEELQYSRFKGALQLGVVDEKILNEMYPIVTREKDFETNRAIVGAGKQLNELTGSVDSMLAGEAETIKDRWKELHPGIQLAVLGVMLYGMAKSTTVRWLGIGAGAAYLIHRLGFGEKDPLGKWSSLAGAPFAALQKRNATDFGQSITPGIVSDVMDRASLYVRFMKKFDTVNMEQQAVGLGILNDMSLRTLAMNFEMGGKDDEEFYLNVKGMSPLLDRAMEDRGWNADYHKFYADPENQRQSSEAMGWIFYLRAAQDLNNADEVEFIEEVRRDLPPGSSISRLPSPWSNPDPMKNQRYDSSDPKFAQKMKDAEQEYVRLVSKGRMMCLNDDQLLGDFVVSQMILPKALTGDRGRDVQVKTADGVDVHRKTADGVDVTRKTADGVDVSPKTAHGIDVHRKTADGVDVTRKTADGVDATKKTADGIDVSSKTADDGKAQKKISTGSAEVKEYDPDTGVEISPTKKQAEGVDVSDDM